MKSAGQEYGEKILKKINAAVYEGRKVLADSDNYYVEKYLNLCDGDYITAQECLIESEDFKDFIFEYLQDEVTDLMREIFLADNHGTNYAGFVDIAPTREDYAKKEVEQIETFYHDLSDTIALRKRVNKITTDFNGFMAEGKNDENT